MIDINCSDPEPGPGPLADYLAELLERFRHFSDPLESSPGFSSHLARIKVSARLITGMDQPAGTGGEGFVNLSGVLGEWVAFFETSPESFPRHLAFPLEHLADYLEDLLGRRDQGVPVTDLAGDQGWTAVLASFRHAGTPLSVLVEVEDIFRKWGLRWNFNNLTPVQEKQLNRLWLRLRKKGDVLFQPEAGRDTWSEISEGNRGILLLVDSSFRRDLIRDKLTDRGFRVEIPLDPDQALEFLAAGPPPAAVLCDNLEPTRHLACLRRSLSSPPGGAGIPMVLIVGSSLAWTQDEKRARSLGAVAAWGEPFDLTDLNRILQRLSRP